MMMVMGFVSFSSAVGNHMHRDHRRPRLSHRLLLHLQMLLQEEENERVEERT